MVTLAGSDVTTYSWRWRNGYTSSRGLGTRNGALYRGSFYGGSSIHFTERLSLSDGVC